MTVYPFFNTLIFIWQTFFSKDVYYIQYNRTSIQGNISCPFMWQQKCNAKSVKFCSTPKHRKKLILLK